jgi:carbon monoxide dehydrogenase subunit G
MILANEIVVDASPDEVFALVTDVPRVVGCVPGASVDGSDGDTHRGAVKVKVGPISAAYAGTVRFLDVDREKRHLRIQARGAETKGGGDAEAEITLDVEPAPDGSLLRLSTDLVVRGKIAQFGKGAIAAVSDKLLKQFADNLAGLLRAPVAASRPVLAPAPAELDGVAMLFGPSARKYGLVAAAFAFGVFQGWLLGTLRSQSKRLKELRRG